MKNRSIVGFLFAVMISTALAVTTTHAQSAESPLQFERGFPTAGTIEKVYDASDLRRAIEAYKFFYPTMGSEAVMQQMLTNGAKINKVGHVMATTSTSKPATRIISWAMVFRQRWADRQPARARFTGGASATGRGHTSMAARPTS